MRAILAAAVAILVSFTLVIALGFRLRPRFTAVSDTVFGALAAFALVILACAIYFALLGIRPWRRPARFKMPEPREPDPPCDHLLPVEQALRDAGIKVRLRGGRIVSAECRVHEPELIRLFPPLAYREGFQPERSQWDNPYGSIYCPQCGHGIFVLHPLECAAGTPWFPSAP